MTRRLWNQKTLAVRSVLFVLGATTSLLACQGGAVDARSTNADDVAAQSPGTAAPRGPGAASLVSGPAVGAATAELAGLDQRWPVPLLPIMAWHQKQSMMQHLVVIQEIVAAAAKEDWNGVATAAKGIEASEAERRSCEHMGAGADGFTQLALDFHDRATLIGKAADARDGTGVLQATANTLQACTSCHATYRQELVDEASWKERTGGHISAHDMH